uniref:Ovule protein n=1 Tax=Schistosoma curassoni TaxID=6186 RepID=A0A183KMN8_9TREM
LLSSTTWVTLSIPNLNLKTFCLASLIILLFSSVNFFQTFGPLFLR